jgi:hypothetical protein
MRLLRSTLAFALGCALVAGCSGGGNTTPAKTNAAGQTPVGTTSIAIPNNPVSLSAGLSSNGYTYTASSIPVYGGYNTIYVAEYTDNTLTTLLASGYSNEFYASPGSTGNVSVIMNMNVIGIATTNSATGAGATVLTEGEHICAAGVPVISFYAVDPLLGFVGSPYGGIPDIQIDTQSSSGTSVLARNPLGGFVPTFDVNADPISVELGLAWTVSYYNIGVTIYNASSGC